MVKIYMTAIFRQELSIFLPQYMKLNCFHMFVSFQGGFPPKHHEDWGIVVWALVGGFSL